MDLRRVPFFTAVAFAATEILQRSLFGVAYRFIKSLPNWQHDKNQLPIEIPDKLEPKSHNESGDFWNSGATSQTDQELEIFFDQLDQAINIRRSLPRAEQQDLKAYLPTSYVEGVDLDEDTEEVEEHPLLHGLNSTPVADPGDHPSALAIPPRDGWKTAKIVWQRNHTPS